LSTTTTTTTTATSDRHSIYPAPPLATTTITRFTTNHDSDGHKCKMSINFHMHF
jgi:hypothetical protein